MCFTVSCLNMWLVSNKTAIFSLKISVRINLLFFFLITGSYIEMWDFFALKNFLYIDHNSNWFRFSNLISLHNIPLFTTSNVSVYAENHFFAVNYWPTSWPRISLINRDISSLYNNIFSKSYCRGSLIQHCQSGAGVSQVERLVCTWRGEARHTEHWGWKWSVWDHIRCMCVTMFVCQKKRARHSESKGKCVKSIYVRHCTTRQFTCACEWSGSVCMQYITYTFCECVCVCVLTYVFVHSHMTWSLCVWVPRTSPLCSSLIIFITAIWMCRAHDECATQVWLAPNRILGYASSRQQGPRVADNAVLTVTHTYDTHTHTHTDI